MSELLKHEVVSLSLLRESLEAKRIDLAYEKSEAQGPSFDWHDNAGLDAVEQAQGLNGGQIKAIDQLLRDAGVIEYPAANDRNVRIGSLVLGRASFGPMPFLIVGQLLTGAERYKQVWDLEKTGEMEDEDLSVISTASPLGAAAINAALGSVISYKAGDRVFNVTVDQIDQAWIVNNFSN